MRSGVNVTNRLLQWKENMEGSSLSFVDQLFDSTPSGMEGTWLDFAFRAGDLGGSRGTGRQIKLQVVEYCNLITSPMPRADTQSFKLPCFYFQSAAYICLGDFSAQRPAKILRNSDLPFLFPLSVYPWVKTYLPPVSGVRNWGQCFCVDRHGASRVSATCSQRAPVLGIRLQPGQNPSTFNTPPARLSCARLAQGKSKTGLKCFICPGRQHMQNKHL